jgi:hypothetical protein
MLEVQHPVCIVALIAHMHRGRQKFIGLEALYHSLGGESLNGLPINAMGRSEL